MKRTRIRNTIIGAACLSFGLAACSSEAAEPPTVGDDQPTESVAADTTPEGLPGLLPAEVRDAGTIKVATSLYPPVDFYKEDGETLTGFDYEVVEATADALGLTVEWNVIDFASVIPGIESGQYDFATDINDTAEREEVVDFVTTFRDGTSIAVQPGNPLGLTDLESLCGHTVLATQGSTQVDLVATTNESCSTPIELLEVPDDPEAQLAMQSERADAYLVNTLAGSYAAEQSETKVVEILPGVYDDVFAGWIFPKGSPELRDAFQEALQSLIEDGTYLKIMESYGVSNNAIDQAIVNAEGGG